MAVRIVEAFDVSLTRRLLARDRHGQVHAEAVDLVALREVDPLRRLVVVPIFGNFRRMPTANAEG